jgi:hypothetical protein
LQRSLKRPIEFPNDNNSNTVGLLEEDICDENENESNVVHNNLQLLTTNNVQSSVKNVSNVVHNNLQLLGINNSDGFITESAHRNPQELYEQRTQMSKDTGLNLIERSITEVNNFWSTLMRDERKSIDIKDNVSKELVEGNSESTHNQPNCHKNKKYYEDSTKHHYEVKDPYNRHIQDDYYHYEVKDPYNRHIQDDYYHYEGMKDQMGKYSNDLQNRMDDIYNRRMPKNYYDYTGRYNEDNYYNVGDGVGGEVEKCSKGAKIECESAIVSDNALHGGLLKTYETAKINSKLGYNARKENREGKNNAQHYYKIARHKTSKGRMNLKGVVDNDLQRMEDKLHYTDSDIDNGDDEEHDEFSES